MNKLTTFAAAVAVVSSALFAQDSITFDLSQMKGTSVAMVAEPITNKLVLYPSTNSCVPQLAPYEMSDVLLTRDSIVAARSITNRVFDAYCTTNIALRVRAVLSVDGMVKQLREQGDMTNLVKKLVESGDVCAVVGHKWEYFPHVTLEHCLEREYPEHRKCTL